MLPRPALTFALVLTLYSTAAGAQTPPAAGLAPADQVAQYDTPAYVAGVDGAATLERDGRVETSPLNMPLLSGDRLQTRAGRVEVRFADGGRLFLDNRTTLDVMSDELVRLVDGRVRIMEVRSEQVSYRIDSTAGSARLLQAGDYRVALLHGDQETQIELAVIRGAGEIFTEQGTTPVRAGERAYASAGLAPSYAYTYNSANMDEFDQWTEMQRGTVYAAPSSQSAEYLPADMSTYAPTFDQYGDWRYQQDYGYVWYPRVASAWRPYYYGRWASYPQYGWTWVAADPFGYPTHHYGRWGVSAGAWFWIPSHFWGPAYVSWGYAPSYVSWCPLGWNNHAVFSLNYYNVGPAYYSSHYHGHYASAWTTVPYGSFGHGYAHQHAVNFDHGYTGARPHFSEGRAQASDRAVARGTAAPVRYAGTRAVASGSRVAPSPGARAESPRYINRGDQIVRSQTDRPTPPRLSGSVEARGTAVARTAPSYAAPTSSAPRRAETPYSAPATRSAPAGADRRQSYAWDNPSYRPQTETRGYERAVPRSEAPNAPAYVPNYGAGRTYARPNAESPRPGPGATTPNRSFEPAAPRMPAPPAAPPSYQRPGGYERPAPVSPRPGGGGGERAAPRPGAAAPPSAPSRSEGRAAPARGGRGR